jgi:methionyl aminopeptidase
MDKASIKTPEEVQIMAEGGAKLRRVKKELMKHVKVGVSAAEIDDLAEKLILDEGAVPSFKMVPGYHWTTCINVNDGIVHGIPKKELVFKEDDIVSVDVGLFYKGFHADTSMSTYLGKDKEKIKFLDCGRKALKECIKTAKKGKKIGDISAIMEATLESCGYKPVRALVGHGVGRELHEAPAVPCFVSGSRDERVELVPGLVIAIEVMYAAGKPDLVTDSDGWTIRTRDGKITALFEETVAITSNGPLVLT